MRFDKSNEGLGFEDWGGGGGGGGVMGLIL